jgi:hypothetical protein
MKTKTLGKNFHVYKVAGKDHLGPIEAYRRYKEFDILRKVLYTRFLGLYVPPLPEKKSVVRLPSRRQQCFIGEQRPKVC